jgi:anthranilate phosphoribosyltransferase
MSVVFRELLRKVGSGSHTSENLTRAEAATATEMMLRQEATPAQIGAFMIAHRIKRPTGEELAGILDAYDRLGPKLQGFAANYPTVVLGIPYDGRSRTAPISPLTALLLTAAGCPVVMHGGRRMPTKEGVTLAEVWQGLGADLTHLTLAQAQQVFEQTRLGFVYLPQHFHEAEAMVTYREELGKRPPFATAELFWCPYEGEALVISGFVHPPTEEMARSAFALRGHQRLITVKGLEGSGDLPRDRTCIVGINQPEGFLSNLSEGEAASDRLLLHPRDYGFAAPELALPELPQLQTEMQATVQGEPGEMLESAVWNGGFYLWQAGVCPTFEAGLEQARAMLKDGQVAAQLVEIKAAIAGVMAQELTFTS